MTVCFLGLLVNGKYHSACRYSGPMVWNSAAVTFWKMCYYGRQWDFIWYKDTCSEPTPDSDSSCNTQAYKVLRYMQDVEINSKY